MAKKDETDLDDLDLDNFDFDDDEFSIDPPEDTRSPVRKVATSFLGGVKDDLLSASNLKRRLLGVLPEGYGKASNLADEVSNTSKELYHTAATELRPASRQFKRATDRLMPKVEGKVPKSWSDKMREFSERKDEDDKDSTSKESIQQGEIDRNLAEIFDTQLRANAQMEEEKTERTTAENKLRDKMAENRNRDLLGQLDAIRQATYRQVSFQDQVTARYQKKSLELQYRQFFALREMVQLNRDSNKSSIEHLASIVHNTALPEYQKTQLSEAGGQMMRDRMLNATQQGVVNYASSFMNRARENIKGTVKRNFQDFSQAVQGAGDQLEMAKDATEGIPGMDKYTMAGSTLGGLAGDKIFNLAAPYLRDNLRKNDRVRQGSDFLSYYIDSLPQHINQWAQTDNGETGVRGALIRFLKDTMPKHYQDTVAGEAPILDGDRVATFNHQTRRSINEVIPGYLARIHQELAIMRTGDDSTGRITYNMDRGEFTSMDQARKDVIDRIFDRDVVESSSRTLNDFVDGVDTDGRLSEEARQEFSLQMMRDVSSGLPFDPARLSDASYYSSETLSAEDRSAIASLIAEKYGVTEETDENGRLKKTFRRDDVTTQTAQRFNELATAMPDPRQRIMGYRESGNRELLDRLGLIERQGSFDYVNYDRVWDTYRRGVATDNGDTTPTGATGGPGTGGMGGPSTRNRPGLGDIPSTTANVSPYPPGGAATGGMGQVDFGQLITAQQAESERILEAIRNNHVRPQADAQVDLLTRILERLDAGIDLRTGEGGSFGEGGFVRGAMGRARAGFGRVFDGVSRFYGGVFGGMGSTAQGAGNLARGALSRVGSMLQKGKERITDVYIKGEVTPRLLKAKMMAGEYRDQVTGKIISSWEDLKDLKGPVVDRMGNVIISMEDLNLGIVTKEGKSILKKGFDFLMGYYRNVFGVMTAPVTAAWKTAGWAKDKVLEWSNRPVDVYVKGEEHPRLLATILKHGGYFNQESGDPIFRVKDIADSVVDRRGNIVLSLEDMRLGLVDVRGNPIGTGGRLGNLISKAVRAPGKLLKWGIDKAQGAFNIVKGAITGGMSSVMDRISGDGLAVRQLGVIEEIRDLLLERLPKPEPKNRWDTDGDGMRENSWREQLAERKRRKAEKEAEEGEEPTGEEKTHGGYLSRLGGLLGSIMEFFGGDNGTDIHIDPDFDRDGDRDGGRNRNRRRPRGRFGRMWDAVRRGGSKVGNLAMRGLDRIGAGNAVRTVGRGARGLARGAGAVGRGAMWAGRGAMALGSGSLLAGTGSAIAGGLSTAAGAIGSGIATGAAAVGGVLSAPVLLTAGAVALAAGGGYLAYKHFTRDKSTPLRNYRIAQYGLDPQDDGDVQKILFLEDFYLDRTTWNDTSFEVSIPSEEIPEMLEGLGITQSNQGARSWFSDWQKERFHPIFEKHLNALRGIAEDVKLKEVDEELTNDQKMNYLNGVGFSYNGGSPYDVMAYPFFEEALPTTLKEEIKLYEDVARQTVQVARGEGNARQLNQLKQSLAEMNGQSEDAAEEANRRNAETTRRVNEQLREREGNNADNLTPLQRFTQQTRGQSGGTGNEALDNYLNQQNGSVGSDPGGPLSSGGAINHPGNGTGGNINELPNPAGDGSWDVYKDLIIQGSRMAGVDPGMMATMAAIESSFRGKVRASTSSATGLYQFISSTWQDMLRKYGDKYGISPNTPPTDVRANTLMGAEFLKENMRHLERVKDGDITDTDLYAAHFMGAGGASTLLRSNPGAIAAHIFPRPAAANESIFYDNGRPRTIREVYQELDRRVSTRRDRYADQARELAQMSRPAANDEEMSPSGPQPSLDASAVAAATAMANGGGQEAPEDQSQADVARSLMDRTTPRSTVTAPTFSGSQETRAMASGSSGPDVLGALQERRRRQEQEAIARDVQGQQRNENQSQAMQSLVGILEQSLSTQMSIDVTLKEIKEVLNVSREAEPSRESPQQEITNSSRRQRGNRPTETTTSQAPIDVRRRRA